MKLLIALLISIWLAGCASVSVVSPDGTRIKTTTLWKDIKAAEAQTENMVLSLGQSTPVEHAQTLVALCLLFPQMEGCP